MILRYGAVALTAVTFTALYLQSERRRADQTCFTNLTLVDGQLQSGSSEMTFSSDADFITIMIENNAPNQLMDFFLQLSDGPAEIDPDFVGEKFSVCKTNGKLEVSSNMKPSSSP